MYNMNILKVVLVATLLVSITQCIPDSDLMQDGIPQYNTAAKAGYDAYSGFLQTSSSNNHYVFLTKKQENGQTSKFSDFPIVLWLQGGQGCSSLISLVKETGPSFMKYPNTVFSGTNAFAWNTYANVLYIEAPGDVGFSQYTGTEKKFGDQLMADNIYESLNLFFTNKFTEFKDTKIILAGEGLAGQFIPLLGQKLVNNPLSGGKLSSILIGNGVLMQNDSETYEEKFTHTEFLDMHGLYGPTEDAEWFNCIERSEQINNPRCQWFAMRNKHVEAQLNPFNVNAPCQKPPQGIVDEDEDDLGEYATCLDWEYIENYFNDAENKVSFNIPESDKNDWVACDLQARQMWQNYADADKEGSVGVLTSLLTDSKISVTLYNGLNDSTIPHYVTQDFVDDIRIKIKATKAEIQVEQFITAAEHPQIGGWTTGYLTSDNTKFQYVRVRAAGHEVPGDQPAAAAKILQKTISGSWIQ